MSVRGVVVGALLAIGALYLVTRFSGATMDEETEAKVTGALNGWLAETDPVCVIGGSHVAKQYQGTFGPFDGPDPRPYPWDCPRCNDLVEAGLMTRTVREVHVGSRKGTEALFALTPLGRETYRVDAIPVGDSGNRHVRWKFCFGKTRLHEIEETLPPMTVDGVKYIGVKFSAEVVEAHRFLFDPQNKPLRLQTPGPGEPPLLEPRVTSIGIRADGKAEVRDEFRYGRFMDVRSAP